MLFSGAGLLVAVLYDPRYGEVARVLQILALGLLVERFTLAQHAYLAIGKPRYLVVINTVRLVSIYTLLPLGFYIGGFYGAVIAAALRDLPIVPVIFFFNSKHQLNNARLEIGLLAFWPAGFALGLLLESAANAMRYQW
jgi:O-antigen/teichoic acid export membrane protein